MFFKSTYKLMFRKVLKELKSDRSALHGILGTRELLMVYGKIQKVRILLNQALSILEPGIRKFKFPII